MLGILREFEVIPLNCLWANPDDLMGTIRLMRDQDEDRYWLYCKEPLDLKHIYFLAPPKGGAHLPKFAVWRPSTMSFGSILVPNYGDELIQLMRHLNKRFRIRYFSAHISRNHEKEGLCRFEHADDKGARRVVHVIRDKDWEFYQQGEILPFENPLHYQSRRVVERLTPAIVIGYLKALGWDLDLDDFWTSNDAAWVAQKTKFR